MEFIVESDNKIIINVIGLSASGKTTIQQIIGNALIEHGFNVELNSVNDEPYVYVGKERIKAIKAKNEIIIINEIQAVKTLNK